MSDPLTDWLKNDTSSSRHARLDAEDLERFGKDAAVEWVNNRIPLTETVTKLASSRSDINAEQIQRICEFANQNTYLLLHERNKVAQAETSYPTFPVADPAKVIEKVSNDARSERVDVTDLDYSRAPYRDGVRKSASVKAAQQDAILEGAFGKPLEEVQDKSSVLQEMVGLRDKLAGAVDHLKSSGETIDLHSQTASEEYYQAVREHLLDGNSFGEVLHAAQSLPHSKEKVASVLQPVVGRLMREKVASPMKLTKQAGDVEKLAHRVLDTSHPLVTLLGAAIDLQEEVKVATLAIRDTEEQHNLVKNFIKEEFA